MITTLIIFAILFAYLAYQLFRNNATCALQLKWIDDDRWDLLDKYSYEYVFIPGLSNWLGLQYPNESNYK